MKEILVIGILISLIIPPIISILFGGADIGKNKEKFTPHRTFSPFSVSVS